MNRENFVSQQGFIRSYQSTIGLIQRLSDMLLIMATLWLSVWLTGYSWSEQYAVVALGGALVYYFLAEMNGMYASWRGASFLLEFKYMIWTWLWVVPIFLLIAFVIKVSSVYSRQAILTWFVLVPLAVGLWRWAVLVVLKKLRHLGFNVRRVAIAGAGDLGSKLLYTIQHESWMGMEVVGFYDDKREIPLDSVPVLGNLDALIEAGKKGQLDRVYIALPLCAEQRIKTLLSGLSDTAVTVYMIPDLFVFELLHSRWQNLGGLPVISIHGTPFYGLGGLLKRLEDIIISLLILIIITAPMLIIALCVKLTSKGPIFFKQRRYGLGGENIWVWKFRTMTVCDAGETGTYNQASRNDDRITCLGSFLRHTSLDELPQFINVLQGRMSVVGPRPHPIMLNEQFRQLIPKYMLRHIVKPGITGWAQINGFRGETDTLEKMEQRITYDLFYIENWSLWFDIKIVFLTIFKGFVDKNAF